MSPESIVALVWAIGGAVAGGIAYEKLRREKNDEEFFSVLIALLWPLIPACAVLFGAIWCASWLGRGPYLLVECARRHRRERRALPAARVHRELPP